MVTPGQFCSKLQNVGIGPSFGEGPHVAQIPEAKALDARKFRPKILRQPVYYFGSPAFSREAGRKILPDGPVQ
jgi:hypothetical protein